MAAFITETVSRKNIIERPGYKEWATDQMLPAGRWNQPEEGDGADRCRAAVSECDYREGHGERPFAGPCGGERQLCERWAPDVALLGQPSAVARKELPDVLHRGPLILQE